MTDKKILITSALPYVNNVPHLGNIVGCVLRADVYNRACREQKLETLFICGADEYGTSTEVKAREEKITPFEVCNKYIEIHKKIYDWFGIKFDYFGRTSTPEPFKDMEWNHTKIAQDIFVKLADNGYLLELEMEQLFCEEINSFVADRFVVGTCPKCKTAGAKGDQCDKCQTLLNAVELLEPRYKFNNDYVLKKKKTEHLFLDLPKLEPELRKWYDVVKKNWAQSAVDITDAWLKEGLKPRCITRDFKWGTPVPDTKRFGDKYKDKIMYNWFDAPIGYLSITSHCPGVKNWEDWWKKPDEINLVQFFGVDNCTFHSIIFPSSLIGTIDNYTLVSNISSCFYLNYNHGKFSKSENRGVFGTDVMELGIEPDIWRYYLLIQIPENMDAEFTWDDFAWKVNSDLADNIGNFIMRSTSLLANVYKDSLPLFKENKMEEKDKLFIKEVSLLCQTYTESIKNISLKSALRSVINIGHAANKYFQDMKPWTLKGDLDRFGTVMNIMLHTTGLIAKLIKPFLPTTSKKIFEMINNEYHDFELKFNVMKNPIDKTKLVPLFKKIENSQIEAFKKKFG